MVEMKCPKRNGETEKGKRLVSFIKVTLEKEDDHVGDYISARCEY